MNRTNLRRLDAATGALSSLALLAAWVALWWLASTGGWVNRAFLPTPTDTVASLLQGLSGGELLGYTGEPEMVHRTNLVLTR